MSATATQRVYTPEEFLRLPDEDWYELIDGRLVEMKMGAQSSFSGTRLAWKVDAFCDEHGLGWLWHADLGFQCFPWAPLKVRKPDLGFVAKGRLPGEKLPLGYVRLAPDLVAEIVSPNDTYDEVDEKVEDYLRAGVRLVWVICIATRSALVYRQVGSVAKIRADQELDGENVIPGFRCLLGSVLPRPENMEPLPGASTNGQ